MIMIVAWVSLSYYVFITVIDIVYAAKVEEFGGRVHFYIFTSAVICSR